MREYKVLGSSTREVDGIQVSLSDAFAFSRIAEIEGVLNSMAADGWELFSLPAPYVFVRDIS